MAAIPLRQWWRFPFWLAALGTGAKSFADNPILGSRRLNRAGLHRLRVRAAHAMAARRRRRLSRLLPRELREQFDRDGFVVVRDIVEPRQFEDLRDTLLELDLETREQQQGDTLTGRVTVGPELLRRIPALGSLLESSGWRGVVAYVASTRSRPLYYLQTIAGGVVDGPPDPQLELHADTFHPSMKAWLFLTDVGEHDRPLTYVPGSHRLTEARARWEQSKSVDVLRIGDRLSQRGSFRVSRDELPGLGLPDPIRFCVPANTLVVADTCGFHARADSHRPSLRIELWAYCRRSPYLPWTGLDLLSWKPVADRRMEWLSVMIDGLDRLGWLKQHWKPVGRRRLCDMVSEFHADRAA